MQGSVVLLDFACGQNYLHAASLGAKAIVFFDNGGVNREQAADKFLKVPVDIPRFWLERQDALDLLARLQDGPVAVHLNARMDWEGRGSAQRVWLPARIARDAAGQEPGKAAGVAGPNHRHPKPITTPSRSCRPSPRERKTQPGSSLCSS